MNHEKKLLAEIKKLVDGKITTEDGVAIVTEDGINLIVEDGPNPTRHPVKTIEDEGS